MGIFLVYIERQLALATPAQNIHTISITDLRATVELTVFASYFILYFLLSVFFPTTLPRAYCYYAMLCYAPICYYL